MARFGVAQLADAATSLSAAQAIQFVRQSGDKLVAILNGPDNLPEQWRQLQALIDERVDVNGIARFALGRFWNVANSQQRDEYLQLFPSVLAGYLHRMLGTYRSISFAVDHTTQLGSGFQVWTVVLLPSVPPRHITWAIDTVNAAPKIVDIIVEGASLRVTRRDDYTNFLAHNNQNIPALLDTLRRQT